MNARVLLVVGLLAAFDGVARAEDAGFFEKGTWTATAYGSYVKSFTGEEAKMGSGQIGGGYYLLDNFSINAELGGFYNSQWGPDARITEGDLLLRHHLFHSGRFSLFIDGVAGISYADHRTPAIGTYYNYILEFGVGSTFQLYENVHLIGGVRYFHLSNAYLEGPDRNPSINATQGYVGLLFKF